MRILCSKNLVNTIPYRNSFGVGVCLPLCRTGRKGFPPVLSVLLVFSSFTQIADRNPRDVGRANLD